jgi:hypothetical protein
MALTVPGPAFAPGFDATLIDADDWILSAAAQSGSVAAWSMLRGPFRGTPQFQCMAKTTDNTAASNTMDLTTLGLTFPAKSFRRVYFRSTAVNGADTWSQEWEQVVWGNDGTTPKLLGSPRLLNCMGQINGTAVQYGLCKGSWPVVDAVIGTINALHSTAGLSIGAFSSGAATITHPIARATVGVRSLGAHFSADVSTIGERRECQVVSQASATTCTLTTATNNGTEAVSDPTDDGELEVELFILPPPSIALVMSTNNVQVHVGYDATDNVYHRVEVWAARADIHALAID